MDKATNPSAVGHTHTAHPITESGQAFLDSLTPQEKALQDFAREQLGSSYFVEKTHAYKKWILSTVGTTSKQ